MQEVRSDVKHIHAHLDSTASGNAPLAVLVPTRGRPQNAERLLRAWESTVDTTTPTDLIFLVDADDPEITGYRGLDARTVVYDAWQPMVHKLNAAAVQLAPQHYALGFMGDDHLPRTPGWNSHVVAMLRKRVASIVYGDDKLMGRRLPTHWMMTSNIVHALGRMVPAQVQHLYCDNSILDLGRGASCITYAPGVIIEHLHPLAGKAKSDAGYERVNSTQQYRVDRASYYEWKRKQYPMDARKVRALNGRRRYASRV